MATKKYNVGIIGYGMSAKVFHIPLVTSHPAFSLHSILQRRPTPDNLATEAHPGIKVYSTTNEMFVDADIDLIVITTTPDSHFALAKSAIEHDKHVMVEKPFVPTSEEADTLIALAKDKKRLICIYQNRRWDTDFLTVQSLLRNGTLGRTVEFETHFDRFKPSRPATWKGELDMDHAGGVIYDLGTHLLDQVYVLFGMPKSIVTAFRNNRQDGHAEPDGMTMLLTYEEGKPLVTVKASIMSVEASQLRFWVRGTQGSYHKCNLDVQEEHLKAGMKPFDDGFGKEGMENWAKLTTFRNGKPIVEEIEGVAPQTYMQIYEELAKALDAGAEDKVPVRAKEARDVLKIIEAARESAKMGRIVYL